MSIETCACCGTPFPVLPAHPMWIDETYCPFCSRAIRERVLLSWDTDRRVPAMRCEEL